MKQNQQTNQISRYHKFKEEKACNFKIRGKNWNMRGLRSHFCWHLVKEIERWKHQKHENARMNINREINHNLDSLTQQQQQQQRRQWREQLYVAVNDVFSHTEQEKVSLMETLAADLEVVVSLMEHKKRGWTKKIKRSIKKI